jgi:uncharacterized protein YihD (DUF1040 family)
MLQPTSQDIKLRIIEQLVAENNIDLLNEIKKLIQVSHYQSTLKKLTQDEIVQRAMKANSDILNNKLYSQKEAENLSKMW